MNQEPVRGNQIPVRRPSQTGNPQNTHPPVRRTPTGNGNPNRQPRPVATSGERQTKREAPSETVIRLKGAPDRLFMVLVILLVCLGTAMVFSASYAYAEYHFDNSLHFIKSQIIWAAVGFVAMFLVSLMDYRWYQSLTVPAFIASLALLALVPFIGKVVNGAKRWIVIGPIQVQPSEVMKLALIMVLSLYIAGNRGKMDDFRHGILFPYTIIGLVCFITALEKHLSATIILLIIGTIVIFIGGAPTRWLARFLLGGSIIVGVMITFFPYARARMQYWLHPDNAPADEGYQLLQSLYAIGSGGLLGKGLGNSQQKYLYLPESQNDFIYSIICEEFGLIGATAVIVLFALLFWRGVYIARRAPDTYSTLLVFGIISQVGLQCIMNIAVVTGSMPVTGVSLPFFSYGGSSLIMLMFQMGMILSVSRFSYQKPKRERLREKADTDN